MMTMMMEEEEEEEGSGSPIVDSCSGVSGHAKEGEALIGSCHLRSLLGGLAIERRASVSSLKPGGVVEPPRI